MSGVADLSEYYFQKHGTLPQKVEDFGKHVDIYMWQQATGRDDLNDAISFIKDESDYSRKIVAITTGRVLDARYKGPGRYVVWMEMEKRKSVLTWEYEADVIDFFKERGLKLPSAPSMRQPSLNIEDKMKLSSEEELRAYEDKEKQEWQRMQKEEQVRYEEWKKAQNKSKQIAGRNRVDIAVQAEEDKKQSRTILWIVGLTGFLLCLLGCLKFQKAGA